MPVRLVGDDLSDDLRHLFLQLANELGGLIFVGFDVAQLLLPDACQLGALEQILVDEVDELDARGRSHEALALLSYIMALEERLDDGGACRGAPDAVLLHGGAQLLVVDESAGGLHGAQQRRLGVVGWGRGPLLRQRRLVRAALALREGGECAFFLLLLLLVLIVSLRILHIDGAPARVENGLACRLKDHSLGPLQPPPTGGGFSVGLYWRSSLPQLGEVGGGRGLRFSFYLPQHRRLCKSAVGIEGGNEAAGNEVVDLLLQVGQGTGNLARGDDGVVVGHLRRVEHLLRLRQLLAPEGAHQLGIRRLAAEARLEEAVHRLRTLGIDVVRQECGVDARIGRQLQFVELLDEL